jgi:hypothetical protein
VVLLACYRKVEEWVVVFPAINNVIGVSKQFLRAGTSVFIWGIGEGHDVVGGCHNLRIRIF